MENKTNKKYDILMIVCGLSLGAIEFWLIHLGFFDRINIQFIKAPYAKNLLILAIISLLFSIIILTMEFVIVQLPFLLPIF